MADLGDQASYYLRIQVRAFFRFQNAKGCRSREGATMRPIACQSIHAIGNTANSTSFVNLITKQTDRETFAVNLFVMLVTHEQLRFRNSWLSTQMLETFRRMSLVFGVRPIFRGARISSRVALGRNASEFANIVKHRSNTKLRGAFDRVALRVGD